MLIPRMGGPADLEPYETVTWGVGYLVGCNFRIFTEGT